MSNKVSFRAGENYNQVEMENENGISSSFCQGPVSPSLVSIASLSNPTPK